MKIKVHVGDDSLARLLGSVDQFELVQILYLIGHTSGLDGDMEFSRQKSL